ncbi:MAG: hypothetical protein C0407_08665, partial [Desulfobacca sp.]|nr:hypothetical protein [Desulfobacca sp.]
MSKISQKNPIQLEPEQQDRIYSRIRQGASLRIGTSCSMGVFGWIAYLAGLLHLHNIAWISGCMIFLMVMHLPLNAFVKTSKSRRVYEAISLLTNLLETLGYTAVIYFLGGFRGLYLSPVYAVFITYLGVIAPFRYPFIVAGFCAGSLSLFLSLEYYGFLPSMAPLSEPIIPARYQIGVVLTIIVFLFLCAYISSITGNRLRNSRKRLEEQNLTLAENARKIKQTEKDLREAHQELENRVEVRTAELKEAIEQLRNENRERRHAEEALRESEDRFVSFMENMPGFAILKDHNRRVFYMNPRFKEEFDIREEDLLGQTTDQFWPEEAAERIRQSDEAVLSEGQAIATVEDLPTKEGLRTYQSIKFPIPRPSGPPWLGGIAVDITNLKRAEVERGKMEAQMREVQKLESLGVLAGGIAHDFNNLLMAILGNADLALLSLSPASPALENIEEITRASQRAAELCRQMLAYSGKGRFVVAHQNLSEIVREMSQMLEVSISKKAFLRYSFVEGLPPVEADATQLRQVIMNLITNASEALGENNGLISVSTGVMECDQAYLSGSYLDDQLSEGRY